MRRTVFGLLCLLLSCLPAAADDWMKALILFDAGQYEEALELATPFAEAGDMLALEMLYASYTYGYGVPVDHAKALVWLRKGAGRGNAASQDAMGHHYYEGIGVASDKAEALRWFELAAEQDFAPAIHSLAIMTMNGEGTEMDVAEGWRLMRRAAELDNPDALFMLAGVAMNNAATTGSIDTAMQYLLRAARLGQRQASAMLGVVFEELPEDPDYRLKSAYHYAVAVAAGCTDMREPAAQARARLSAEELEALEYNLVHRQQPETDPRDPQPVPGQCLAG
nr:tetratricopeptide repeat protein [uncultured Devosia sp.]